MPLYDLSVGVGNTLSVCAHDDESAQAVTLAYLSAGLSPDTHVVLATVKEGRRLIDAPLWELLVRSERVTLAGAAAA